MFLLLFVAFASQEVNGQIIVELEELDAASNSSSEKSFHLVKIEKISSDGSTTANVFPNPFSYHLTVQVSNNEGLEYMELLDENGIQVWERNVYSVPDKYIIESLDPGTYYLNLSMSGGTVTETLFYSP